MAKPYQVAAIPIRLTNAGGIEVLLVTSRETKRWVVPKGWPWRKIKDHDAAAGEAWEEAGVRGRVLPKSVGEFRYDKRRKEKFHSLSVTVYLMQVTEEATTWPESEQRQRKWFSPGDAATAVAEPELKSILLALPPNLFADIATPAP